MDLQQASGIVFDVQRFCVHDGPGIRTTVFLKGCPLDCAWCHNPESKRMRPELSYKAAACTGCGRCVAECPHEVHSLTNSVHSVRFEACQACGRCVSACMAGALSIWGARKTVEEIMAVVQKDRAYYATSGGGLTLSGGEPLSQPAFASALLAVARTAGLHTCVETSGYGSAEALQAIAAQTDLFLFDYKITGAAAHRTYTGQDNGSILRNLSWLLAHGHPVCLRCPIIPDINDTDDHLEAIARLSQEAGIQSVEIMPYHDLGRGKAEATGKPYTLAQSSATDAQQAHWLSRLQALGCQKLQETR